MSDKAEKYSPEMIELAVGMILSDLASIDVRPGADNIINSLISKSAKGEVKEDSGDFYFEFPLSPMAGPSSLRHISLTRMGASISIHPSRPAMMMMVELKGGSMGLGVYPDNNRWYFTSDPLQEEVYVSMIPAFSEYDDEDDFVAGDQYLVLYQRIQEMFESASRRLLDQRNDNAVEDEQRTTG